MDAADVNDDGVVDLTDAVQLLNGQFLGGAPPPFPYEDFGLDPTPDTLSCRAEADNELTGCLASDIGSCNDFGVCDVFGYCIDETTWRECTADAVPDSNFPSCGSSIYLLDGEAVFADTDEPVVLPDGSNVLRDHETGEPVSTEITGTFVRCEGIPVGESNLLGETPDPVDVCNVGGCFDGDGWVMGCCIPPQPGGETCVCDKPVDAPDPPTSGPGSIPYIEIEHGACKMEVSTAQEQESDVKFVFPDTTGSRAHAFLNDLGVAIRGNVTLLLSTGVREAGRHTYAQHEMAIPYTKVSGAHTTTFVDKSTQGHRMGWRVTDDSKLEAATDWRNVSGRLLAGDATDPRVVTTGYANIDGAIFNLDYKTSLKESSSGAGYSLSLSAGGSGSAGFSAGLSASLGLSLSAGGSISLRDMRPEITGEPEAETRVSGGGIGGFKVVQHSSVSTHGEFKGNPAMAETLNKIGGLINSIIDGVALSGPLANVSVSALRPFLDRLVSAWLNSMVADSGGQAVALPTYAGNIQIELFCLEEGEESVAGKTPVRTVKLQ